MTVRKMFKNIFLFIQLFTERIETFVSGAGISAKTLFKIAILNFKRIIFWKIIADKSEFSVFDQLASIFPRDVHKLSNL